MKRTTMWKLVTTNLLKYLKFNRAEKNNDSDEHMYLLEGHKCLHNSFS